MTGEHKASPVHFLHIGKTGGSAVKHALRSVAPLRPQYEQSFPALLLHRHSMRLCDIPPGEKFFFFVRDPVSRFVSGFWSGQRQGRPRYCASWSQAERDAFLLFASPDELATALSSSDLNERSRAEVAMRSIRHVRDSYWKWFDNEEYFLFRLDDLLFVGYQSQLSKDFEILKSKLRLPKTLILPTDDVQAHIAPGHLERTLQDVAVRNLRRWYQEDFRFLDLCDRVIRERPLVRAATPPRMARFRRLFGQWQSLLRKGGA